MKHLFDAFQFDGELIDMKHYGNGHINDTYRVTTTQTTYIIQRINHYVFKRPDLLMANFRLVTEYLKEIIKKENGDPLRQTLTIVQTKDGKDYYHDQDGNYYRAILFIDHTTSLESITNVHDFYQTGLAFGDFQAKLADFDASKLYETIPNFHHTPTRYQTFLKALEENKANRKENAQQEIAFILEHEQDTHRLLDQNLPLRVTHNDTKLNNILFESKTMEPLCVIDLDTIMPGLAGYDFGDAIRSGATYALEDEPDLSKVQFDLELFKNFAKGFIEGSKGILTREEILSLPLAAKTITLETAIRFLSDYLDGDLYFKVDYPEHNLIRTRTQIKLVSDMEKYEDELNAFMLTLL